MKKNFKVWIILILFLNSWVSYAFDWPVKEIKIGSTFGQSVAGNFNTGISLIGSDEAVYPIAEGEVVFRYEESRDYTSLPRGLGSFVILYHTGEIQSIYGHLKKGSVANPPGNKVSRETQIGTIGNTGASAGGSLFIQIYDLEENIILNPLKEFNPGLTDKDKPVIEKVFLQQTEVPSELVNNSILQPGNWNVLIQALDIWKDNGRYIRKFTPYKIIMNQNGVEALTLTFDALKEKDNHLVLANSEKSYAEIYEDDWLINLGKINLVGGLIHLQFLVIDYARDGDKAGNQTTTDYKITVKNQ